MKILPLYAIATLSFMGMASIASATANCERLGNSNNFRCDTPSGQAYNVNNAASAEAAAAAIAKQQQGQSQGQGQHQGQGQSQSSSNNNNVHNSNDNRNTNTNVNGNSNTNSVASTNDNSNRNSVSNTIRFQDDSVSLSTPAGGGCTWGVNIGIPGTGGAGICGTTRNATAIAAAQVADQIGNPCLPENRLAAEMLLRAPIFKGMKLSCK